MSSKKTLENTIVLVLVQLVNLGLPLISLPYLARILGADNLGRVVFSLAVAQIFLVLSDYGFNLSATKEVAIYRNDVKKLYNIWIGVTIIRLIFSLIGFLVLLCLIFSVEKLNHNFWLCIFAYISVLGNIIYPQWLFQGLEKLRYVSFIQIISRIILFILLILFVKNKNDVAIAVIIQSAGGLVAGLIIFPNIYILFKDCYKKLPSLQDIKGYLSAGWTFFISNVFGSFYLSFNGLILGFMVSPNQLANYYVAEKLIRAVGSLCSPIGNAIFPKMVGLFQEKSKEALIFCMQIIFILAGGVLIGCIITYFISGYVVDIIFGEEFKDAAILLKFFSPLPVIIMLAIIFGNLIMIPAGLHKEFSRIIISASLLNIFVFFIMTNFFSIIGATFASILVEAGVVFIMLVSLIQNNLNPFRYWRVSINMLIKRV